MHFLHSLSTLVGRLLLALPFAAGAWMKFSNYEGMTQYMASKGMTMIPFFLISALIIEVVGSLGLILGFKTRWAALLLFLFLIPTTLLMHNFWSEAGADAQGDMTNALKNTAILGGLLYVMASGAGRFSLDACCCDRECSK